jgi:hypothetical protein
MKGKGMKGKGIVCTRTVSSDAHAPTLTHSLTHSLIYTHSYSQSLRNDMMYLTRAGIQTAVLANAKRNTEDVTMMQVSTDHTVLTILYCDILC